jgi:hypothetical protein
MFGKGSGWGIPTAAHTLDITLGGIGEKAVRVDGQIEFREYLCMTIMRRSRRYRWCASYTLCLEAERADREWLWTHRPGFGCKAK